MNYSQQGISLRKYIYIYKTLFKGLFCDLVIHFQVASVASKDRNTPVLLHLVDETSLI